MESFFSSLKIERIKGRVYRTRDEARADVFDYIERFYNGSQALDDRLSQPGRVRKEGGVSLTRCPQNRQQLMAPRLGSKA
jgi:transposase InsO family protein